MLPVASGKYIALCECDDLWLDDSKLQKQYDYMEKHPECSLCSHNTLIHCVNEKKMIVDLMIGLLFIKCLRERHLWSGKFTHLLFL